MLVTAVPVAPVVIPLLLVVGIDRGKKGLVIRESILSGLTRLKVGAVAVVPRRGLELVDKLAGDEIPPVPPTPIPTPTPDGGNEGN